jgi:hypothetical protein
MIHQEISDEIGFRQGGHASHLLGIRKVTDKNTDQLDLLGIRQVTDKNITDEVVTFEADEAVTIEANEAVTIEANKAVAVIVEVNEAVIVIVLRLTRPL